MVDLQNGDNTQTVVINLIVAALGLYLALTFNNAVQKTINSWFPNDENSVRGAWISAVIALVLTLVLVRIIFGLKNFTSKKE